jgi:hypothetical protein
LDALSVAEDEHQFDVLRSLLSSASRMVHELLNDPLLERYLDVFARMPAGDRETIVGALEHEVQTRLLSQEMADGFTQVELRPNPKAQLYLRVIAPGQESQIEMVAFLRTLHTMQRGIDALDPHWRSLIGQALRHLDPEALEKLNSFNRAMQELLDEAARAAAASPQDDSPAEDATPLAAAQGKTSGPARRSR